jgi:S-adenosylmethionine hydrolase
MNRIITLTTDFGTADGYVGTMKGVILRINPQATIVDITHEVAPQNIEQGAFLFAASARYFPANTIHVLVVDPGVGSTRRPIAVQMGETTYIAPDNGILPLAIFGVQGYVAPDVSHSPGIIDLSPGKIDLAQVVVPFQAPAFQKGSKMVHLNKPEYWLPSVSNTFHGRDIFAPCAAHVSLGLPLQALGEAIRDWKWTALIGRPVRMKDSIFGRVIHIDHFGNVITNIQEELLRGMDRIRIVVTIRDCRVKSLQRTYADVPSGQACALVDSAGFLEIALRNGSAAQELEIRLGEGVVVSLES